MDFLIMIFRMSLWGSMLTMLILLMKRIIGERMPPTFHYAIWGVLLLRLIVPFSFSYLRPLAVEKSAQPPFTVKAAEERQEDSESPDEIYPDDIQMIPSEIVLSEFDHDHALFGGTSNLVIKLRGLLVAGYMLGCIVYAGAMMFTLARYKRDLLQEEHLPEVSALFKEECVHLCAPKHTQLRMTVSGSPYASGVLHPCVTIPISLTADFSESDLRAVFRHELIHIRCGDTALRVLMAILQGIYWFNPIIWYAFACIRCDGEYACDMRVLRQCSPSERLSYGKAILNVAELYTPETNLLYSRFAMRPLRRRIERIIAYRPVCWWVSLAAVPLIMFGAAAGVAVSAHAIEIFTMDASQLTATEIWRWGSLEHPILAEIPVEDMALYAVDSSLLEYDDNGIRSYDGRVVLRQGERTQVFDWGKIYSEGLYPVMAAGDYNGDGKTEYACIQFGDISFGRLDGSLRLIQENFSGYWDDSVTLDGEDAAAHIARQFKAGEIENNALTFTLNGELHQIALPADLRGKQLLQLKVLPYIRFHSETENELSISVMIGAYFGEHPTFAGYLNAPIEFSRNTLTVGTAIFAGSMFRSYPENWIQLYDEKSGLTLGLPPHWKGNFVNTAPYFLNDYNFRFALYEKYNYNIPAENGHLGYLFAIDTSGPVYEDYAYFLGFYRGRPVYYSDVHNIEYDQHNPDAWKHYCLLNRDQGEIINRFVVVNHMSVKRRMDYWDMML